MTQTETAAVVSPKLPSLWRNKAFNLLWGSQALSGLGSAISGLALPLLTLAITGSPIRAGLVGFGQAIAQLACQLPIGVVIDRVDRRRLMLISDAVRVVAYALLAWAVLTDRATLGWIIVVAAITALFSTMHATAEFSAIRNVVPLSQVPEATALNQGRQAAVGLAGPPIGGALYGVSRGLPFVADAVSFLLSFIGVWLIRQPMQQERTEPREHPVKEFLEGLRFAWREPFLRAVILVAPPLNLALNGLAFAIIVILQQRGTPPVLIGAAETIIAAGALTGAIVAGRVVRRVRLRTIAIGGFWMMSVVIAAGSLVTGWILMAVPLALSLLLMPACNAALLGYQAVITPDRLQGRVISVLIASMMSLSIFSTLVAGAFVQWWGGQVAILAFGGLMAVTALTATLTKGIREMTLPSP